MHECTILLTKSAINLFFVGLAYHDGVHDKRASDISFGRGSSMACMVNQEIEYS